MFWGVRKIHLIGVGGSGMSGIAILLKRMGFDVSGCDINPAAKKLEEVKVVVGHSPEHISDEMDVVVFSSAIPEDNPELVYARSKNIHVIPRFEMLSEIIRLKNSIAVLGSHGKTTTTSLISHITKTAGFDPTVIVGGRIKGIGGAFLGDGDIAVVEVDESDPAFTKLSPTVAILTNLDFEHVDRWGSFEKLKKTVKKFMDSVPFWGFAILCADDQQASSFNLRRKTVTYGVENKSDITGSNIKVKRDGISFVVSAFGKKLGEVSLKLLGRHNVLNALASISAALKIGIDFELIKEALANFEGVERRIEFKGVRKGVTFFDDYGHHPTEIKATLKALREAYPERRIVLAFQPHRFSRTALLMDKFPEAFSLADLIVLTDIYSAGEENTWGVSGKDLYAKLKGVNVIFTENVEEAAEVSSKLLKEGDVFLSMGAGDIKEIVELIFKFY